MIRKVLIVLFILAIAYNAAQAKEEMLKPKKAKVDSNFDGSIDRVEYYDENGRISRVESDTDFNGAFDEWVYYKNGVVEKAEKDTNKDGKPDTFIEY